MARNVQCLLVAVAGLVAFCQMASGHDLPNSWEQEPFLKGDIRRDLAALRDSKEPTMRAGVVSELARGCGRCVEP